MPVAKKTSWAQLRVGIMALAALSILAVLIFLLTGSGHVFEHYVEIRTYVADASGTAPSAPVRLNGILIGNVDQIRLSGSKDPNRAVEFVLSIRENFLRDIPDDSVVSINASSLLGDKFINITRGPNKNRRHVQPGGELKSEQIRDIPELMAESANLLQTLQDILNRLNSMLGDIEAGKGNIGKLLKDEQFYNRLNDMAGEGKQLLSDVRNGHGTISHLLYDDALYQDLRAPLKRLDSLLAGVQKGEGTAGKLMKDPALYEEARQTAAQIHLLVKNMNEGKGTAGKLVKDDQLYRRLNELAAKLDLTLDKINTGKGTIGQLVINPQLYDSMNGLSRELQSLVKDMHTNPKKFLRLKLSLF